MSMTRLVKTLSFCHYKVISRSLSVTPITYLKQWRMAQGLSANRNAEGILRDGPDYTYLDGRPTPLLQKQKKRMIKQQEYAERIVTMCSQLDFAKQRQKDILQAKKEERKAIIENRLKPKGKAMIQK